MSDDVQRTLGRLEGKIDSIQSSVARTEQRVGGIDERLRTVEKKSAINSAVISTAISAGTAALSFKLRSMIG